MTAHHSVAPLVAPSHLLELALANAPLERRLEHEATLAKGRTSFETAVT